MHCFRKENDIICHVTQQLHIINTIKKEKSIDAYTYMMYIYIPIELLHQMGALLPKF